MDPKRAAGGNLFGRLREKVEDGRASCGGTSFLIVVFLVEVSPDPIHHYPGYAGWISIADP